MTKKIEKSLEERMEEWKYSDQTDESAIDVAEDIINEPQFFCFALLQW